MPFLTNFFSQISSLGNFWQEKTNNRVFRWNLFFVIVQFGLLIWKFNNLPNQVPLYYSLPWGEPQLASTSALFLLPIFSLLILLINHLLAAAFLKIIPLLSRLLILMSLIVSLFSLITLSQIINLII
jgi:hypothetical protein